MADKFDPFAEGVFCVVKRGIDGHLYLLTEELPWEIQEETGLLVVCFEGHPETEANARLIAAAPAMLAALEAAVASGMVPVSSAADGGANKHSEQVRIADQIRAAIAQAKGE